MERPTAEQALIALYNAAIHSRNLSPAALPELNQLLTIVSEALKASKIEAANVPKDE